MAETIQFELVSPERLLLAEEAEMVVVPGREGDFAVMAGHAPLLSSLRSGGIDVHGDGGIRHRIYVAGGFAEVSGDRLVVLAEEALPVADLDRAALEQRIRNAEEDVEDAETDEKRMDAQQRLDHLKDILQTL